MPLWNGPLILVQTWSSFLWYCKEEDEVDMYKAMALVIKDIRVVSLLWSSSLVSLFVQISNARMFVKRFHVGNIQNLSDIFLKFYYHFTFQFLFFQSYTLYTDYTSC